MGIRELPMSISFESGKFLFSYPMRTILGMFLFAIWLNSCKILSEWWIPGEIGMKIGGDNYSIQLT